MNNDRSDFSDLAWLFTANNLNRGILRQNFDEAAMLWRAVRASNGPVLEIGRRHGGSTVLLAAAAGERTLTSIDLAPAHNPACDAVFEKILRQSPERLRLIVGDSRRTLPGETFGFAFIDGDHSYEGVKADVAAHWNSLTPIDTIPAYAVFHDAVPNDGLAHTGQANHHEGVRRVCDELIAAGCAERVEAAGSSLWLKKLADLPASFRGQVGATLQEISQSNAYGHLQQRHDVARLLPPGAVGIELGVAEGVFAERVLANTEVGFLYGVDMYAGDRGHDLEQYKRALTRLSRFRGRSALLHMRFDEALGLFADDSLDFIYVDGYAHTGEEDGATFRDWWPKLKPGGVFAGDDYDPAWPDVVRHVDAFLNARGLSGYIIPSKERDVAYCKYPTWFTFKPR